VKVSGTDDRIGADRNFDAYAISGGKKSFCPLAGLLSLLGLDEAAAMKVA
jgi:hypothetical protein